MSRDIGTRGPQIRGNENTEDGHEWMRDLGLLPTKPPQALWRCQRCGKTVRTFEFRAPPGELDCRPGKVYSSASDPADRTSESDEDLRDYLAGGNLKKDMDFITAKLQRELETYLEHGVPFKGVSHTIGRDGLVKVHVSVERLDLDNDPSIY